MELKKNMWFHTTKIIYLQNMFAVFLLVLQKIRNVSTNESLSNKSKNILNEFLFLLLHSEDSPIINLLAPVFYI
jgi:hypothetical protein